MRLFKCITGLVSENLFEVNVLPRPKNSWSLQKVFCPTSSSFWSKVSEEKLFLIRSAILGLLLNTLTANYKLSRSNRENFPLPIQSKLLKQRKSFCGIFFTFLVSTWYLQCSEQKMSLIGQLFLELLTLKNGLI